MLLPFCSIMILLGFFSLTATMNVADLKCFKVGKPGPNGIQHLFHYNTCDFAAIASNGKKKTMLGPIVSKLALFKSFKEIGEDLNDYDKYKYAASSEEYIVGDPFESAKFQLDSKYSSILLFVPNENNAGPLGRRVEVELNLKNDKGDPIQVTGYVVEVYQMGGKDWLVCGLVVRVVCCQVAYHASNAQLDLIPSETNKNLVGSMSCLAVYRDALGPFDFIPDKTEVSSAFSTYRMVWDKYANKKDMSEEEAEIDNLDLDESEENKLRIQRKKFRSDARSTWFLFTETVYQSK